MPEEKGGLVRKLFALLLVSGCCPYVGMTWMQETQLRGNLTEGNYTNRFEQVSNETFNCTWEKHE